MPVKTVELMLAKLVNELPEGDDYLDEPKSDGFRVLERKERLEPGRRKIPWNPGGEGSVA